MSGSSLIQSPSFPRRRESRNALLKKLDARLRGHDGKHPDPPFIELYESMTNTLAFDFKSSTWNNGHVVKLLRYGGMLECSERDERGE